VTAAIFDGADTKSIVPARAETTSATQALFLMNNPLAINTAKRLANQLVQDKSLTTDQQRVERLWLLTYGRSPEAAELEMAQGFVAKYSWERFIQALLGTNEFAYVD